MASPAVISRSSMPLQLAKEIDNIYMTTLAEWDTEYDKVLKVQNAPAGPSYYQAEIAGLNSLPQEIGENDGVVYAVPIEGNPILRLYKQFGLGYFITDLMIKDDRHGNMRKLPRDLAKAMRVLNEIEGLRLYNEAELNGTIGTAPGVAEVKDGRALCTGAGHPLLNDVMGFQQDGSGAGVNTAASTLYNIPYTAGDLTELTFAAAQEYYKQMVDENGFPMKLFPNKLLVPYSDAAVAHRLATQQFGGSAFAGGLGATLTTSGSQENAHMKNYANPSNGFVKGWSVVESRYLDDDRWFLLADVDEGPGFYWKDQPTQTSKVDFDTDGIRYKSKQRFNVWAYEPRGVYGNITGNARGTAL